jgi:hypothetical protein
MDDLHHCLQQTDLKVGDVQVIEGKLADHTSLIVELQVATTDRKDELRRYRKQTSK